MISFKGCQDHKRPLSPSTNVAGVSFLEVYSGADKEGEEAGLEDVSFPNERSLIRSKLHFAILLPKLYHTI